MKKNLRYIAKSGIYFLLVLAICLCTGGFSIGARVGAAPFSKITPRLAAELEKKAGDDIIPVYLWYEDIDQKAVDAEVFDRTGLTRENVDTNLAMPDQEVLKAMLSENRDEAEKDPAAHAVRAYMESSKEGRLAEQAMVDELIMTRRNVSTERYAEKSAKALEALSISSESLGFVSRYAPMVIANLTKLEIERAAKVDMVTQLSLFEEMGLELQSVIDPKESATTIAQMVTRSGIAKAKNQTGLTGAGVKVGMVEYHIPNVAHPELEHANLIPCIGASNVHPTNIARIIVGQYGVAPNATLYALSISGPGLYYDLEELMDEGVTVVNVSFGSGRSQNEWYTGHEQWLDHLIANNSLVLVVAAGNLGLNAVESNRYIYNPGMAYNALTVGSYNDLSNDVDSDDVLCDTSSYYSLGGCSKPDIVANGIYSQETFGVGHSYGTSFAAPVVVGVVTLMMELKPALAIHPQAVKSIILASAHRKVITSAPTPEVITDGLTNTRQGAGALSAYHALRIVAERTYGIGEISSGTDDIKFAQPLYFSSGINVSLAWLRNSVYTQASPPPGTYTVPFPVLAAQNDLDLEIYREGTQTPIASSSEGDSSTEMAYFQPTASDAFQYEMRINKAASNAETVRYGYAWSRSDTLPIFPTGQSGLYYLKDTDTGRYLTCAPPSVASDTFSSTLKTHQWLLKADAATPTNYSYRLYANNPSYHVGYAIGSAIAPGMYDVALTGLPAGSYLIQNEDGTYRICTAFAHYPYDIVIAGTTPRFVQAPVSRWQLETVNFAIGDVNQDGVVAPLDRGKIWLHFMGGTQLLNAEFYLGDLNLDGVIDLTDLQMSGAMVAGNY